MSSSNYQSAAALEIALGVAETDVESALPAREEVLRLFAACAPGLRRYVASCGLSRDAADDVVQEAFVALYRHLCLGRSRRNLRGWLFQVSHRLALKHRARAARQQSREAAWEADIAESVLDPGDGPEAQLAARQRQRCLRSVLRALPERDRQCLHLRAEGLCYREIAATLGVSLGSVAKSIARAVARLSSADKGQGHT